MTSNLSATSEDRLTADIPHLMERARVPGLSIAVVRDAAINWQRGFGVKRADKTAPVEADTVFQAASLSKPVFAYAVLKLAEQGKLDLDTSLTIYLPDPYVPDDPLLDRITARHVLSHTTGWPNWRTEGQPLRRERAPGEVFGYSGEGYNYLQRVIECLVGQPLDAYMTKTLLDPLGMTHSSYAWATILGTSALSSRPSRPKPASSSWPTATAASNCGSPSCV